MNKEFLCTMYASSEAIFKNPPETVHYPFPVTGSVVGAAGIPAVE